MVVAKWGLRYIRIKRRSELSGYELTGVDCIMKNYAYLTVKRKIKSFFPENFLNKIDIPCYSESVGMISVLSNNCLNVQMCMILITILF